MSGADASQRRLLAEALARFAEEARSRSGWRGGFDAEAWNELNDLGFSAVGVSADAGGSGGELSDALLVCEVLARKGLILPNGEHSVLSGWLCEQAGWTLGEELDAVVTSPGALRARLSEGTVVIDGTASGVPWARHAGRLLVLVEVDGIPTICDVDPAGCRIDHRANLAGEPRDAVGFERTGADRAQPLGAGSGEEVMLRGGLIRCAQMAGAMRRALELTVEHVSSRHQFGRPLAAFQAVRQEVAVLGAEVAVAHAAVAGAGRLVDGRVDELAALAARVRVAEAATEVARLAHQLHGAVGTTEEYELGSHTRRLWAWRDEYGRQRDAERRLGRLAAAATPDGLWPALAGP